MSDKRIVQHSRAASLPGVQKQGWPLDPRNPTECVVQRVTVRLSFSGMFRMNGRATLAFHRCLARWIAPASTVSTAKRNVFLETV